MEKSQKELIEEKIKSSQNPKLKKLYADHKSLNEKVEKLSTKTFLTEKEQVELKKLKNQKLDELEEMVKLAMSLS